VHLVEKAKRNYQILAATISNIAPRLTRGSTHIYCQDSLKFAQENISMLENNAPQSGLVFADPMGAGKHEYAAINTLVSSKKLDGIDILVHFQATSTARAWGHRTFKGYKKLRTHFSEWPRKYKYITNVENRQSYGLFFATNNKKHKDAIVNVNLKDTDWDNFIPFIPGQNPKI